MNNPNDAILRTEDGHPIGELVVSTASVPLPAENDGRVKENREELMRAAAAEISGEPDADAAISAYYPGYTDADLRAKAERLFISEEKSLREVAEACGVPERTVSRWSYNYKWVDLVQKDLEIRQAHSRLELARIRADRRAKVARAQLEAAEMVRDKVVDEIGEMSAKSAAEALKSAADVEARILGIKETGETAETSGDGQSQQNGKTPLVMVFQGGLPPVRRSQT